MWTAKQYVCVFCLKYIILVFSVRETIRRTTRFYKDFQRFRHPTSNKHVTQNSNVIGSINNLNNTNSKATQQETVDIKSPPRTYAQVAL